MVKLYFGIILFLLSSMSYSGELSEPQIQQLCKIVDPTFLNQLPVYIELKNARVPRRFAVNTHLRTINTTGVYGTTVPWATAIETMFDSPAKTTEEAIKVIEASCVTDLRSRN